MDIDCHIKSLHCIPCYNVCSFQGQGIGDVSISAGEGLSVTTTAEGVYVLNNVTAGGYTIQVGED